MFRLKSATPTAPAVARPAPRPARHRPRRYPLVRRDPRRFARGRVRIHAPPVAVSAARSDWRFFAHSFGGAFLFVSVLIA